jgi:hypothetical protein|tara:strand:+ start:5399 stop:6589 length:1191 start_codon:yes stop_codon:yes gene_type:complete
MSKCGANEALGALTEKTKDMADTLKDSVDLDKLQEFKDKAESIKGDIKDKLVSQIPKPKNLQVELEKIKGLKEGLAVGAAVLAIEKDFGKALGAGVLTGALKNVLDPVLQGAAGIAAGAEDAISDALGGKSFDICKNVPNVELDKDGEPVEKALVEAKPNEAAEKPKEVEKTVEDSSTKTSLGGGKYTQSDYYVAKAEISLAYDKVEKGVTKFIKKDKLGLTKKSKDVKKYYKKVKKKYAAAKVIAEKSGYKKFFNMWQDGQWPEDVFPFEEYRTYLSLYQDYEYTDTLTSELIDGSSAMEKGLASKNIFGAHPFFDNPDWYDKTKYPGFFVYRFYDELYLPIKRDSREYGLYTADKAIGDAHGKLMDELLAFWQREDIQEQLAILADYETANGLV